MKRLLIVLLGTILLCVTACSNSSELGYRVVQMEDNSYVIQQYVSKYDGIIIDDEYEWKNLCHTITIEYHDFNKKKITGGEPYRFNTREKACMECNEIIQAKLRKENPFKVRRVVNCN